MAESLETQKDGSPGTLKDGGDEIEVPDPRTKNMLEEQSDLIKLLLEENASLRSEIKKLLKFKTEVESIVESVQKCKKIRKLIGNI